MSRAVADRGDRDSRGVQAQGSRIGRVRVGRKVGANVPSIPGFTTVLCLTPSSPYGAISPYCLKDEQGRLHENIWQFAKVYKFVPPSKQHYSRFDRRVIWQHEGACCWQDGAPTADYWDWRRRGMACEDAVRYPVGFHARHTCLGAIAEDKETDRPVLLNYVESRRRIYLPVYARLLKQHPMFRALQARLRKGENLLIVEVDGPHYEFLDYYKQEYDVPDDFITPDQTTEATEFNLRVFLNDTANPFGHGFALAATLLGKDEEWNRPLPSSVVDDVPEGADQLGDDRATLLALFGPLHDTWKINKPLAEWTNCFANQDGQLTKLHIGKECMRTILPPMRWFSCLEQLSVTSGRIAEVNVHGCEVLEIGRAHV